MKLKFYTFLIILFLIQNIYSEEKLLNGENWDNVGLWIDEHSPKSKINIEEAEGKNNKAIGVNFNLNGKNAWVSLKKDIKSNFNKKNPVIFYLKTNVSSDFEVKLIDKDGSAFGKKFSLMGKYGDWTQIVVYLDDLDYWWGGDNKFSKLIAIDFVISGHGKGVVFLDEIGFGEKDDKNKTVQNKSVLNNWDSLPLWTMANDSKCEISLEETAGRLNEALKITYKIDKNYGWVIIRKRVTEKYNKKNPLIFYIKADSPNNLEIKFEDNDGSIFGKKFSLKDNYKEWTKIVLYHNSLEYWWGGDEKLNNLKNIEFAISGETGEGEVLLDEISFGDPGQESTFLPAGPQLDPNRKMKGIGFDQRRASEMAPEDPLVLEYLKQLQDSFSPDKILVPAMEDAVASTFNNALVAMAFILKDEKERAERILDFFAEATDPDNMDKSLQNFFYNGQSRGFYQYVALKDMDDVEAYHVVFNSDRWMGDIAWLLIAYKYYEKKYSSDKYKRITKLLLDLLKDFYIDYDRSSGYVQHGWRKSDSKLHEVSGHPEGNIDCYAVFMLCNEKKYAIKVKKWIERTLKGKENLPLDLYGWRVQAFGKHYAKLLDICEYDLRYRKTLTISDEKVMGFYHGPEDNNNIWLDGVGHFAVAYFEAGNKERGNFYANQLDKMLIDRNFDDTMTKGLPYVLISDDPNYSWVDTKKGFSSVAVWYIFAKNRFNPMKLMQY